MIVVTNVDIFVSNDVNNTAINIMNTIPTRVAITVRMFLPDE
jgi:hypothetical protein